MDFIEKLTDSMEITVGTLESTADLIEKTVTTVSSTNGTAGNCRRRAVAAEDVYISLLQCFNNDCLKI